MHSTTCAKQSTGMSHASPQLVTTLSCREQCLHVSAEHAVVPCRANCLTSSRVWVTSSQLRAVRVVFKGLLTPSGPSGQDNCANAVAVTEDLSQGDSPGIGNLITSVPNTGSFHHSFLPQHA